MCNNNIIIVSYKISENQMLCTNSIQYEEKDIPREALGSPNSAKNIWENSLHLLKDSENLTDWTTGGFKHSYVLLIGVTNS